MKQETALKILQTGANVFLTGEPGSGKTYTVNQYVAWLRAHDIEPAITASTGIAAAHIGGMTIHSWSGIGIRTLLSESDLDTISSNERVVKRITRARILIIDEVSMLSAGTFDMVDLVCREVRQRDEPFGGLQVVLVGDFFQLPPVSNRKNEKELAQFAFNAHAWQDLKPVACYLSEQYRQDDEIFLQFLSTVRAGSVDETAHDLLTSRKVEAAQDLGDITRLYAHNVDVDRVNDGRLAALEGRVQQFMMTSYGADALTSTLKRGCLSPEVLSLKIGARVIFTKNNPNGSFVNGTQGVIEKFGGNGMPIVLTVSGRRIAVEVMEWAITDGTRVLARISQVPLRLAWAITIHKSQGMTLDAAVIDLSQAFEYGQGYVALSRVRTLAGLNLLGWNTRALEVHPETSAQDQNFKESSAFAEKKISGISDEEHTKLINSFIVAYGGKIEGGGVSRIKKDKSKGATLEETLSLIKEGKSIREIAKARSLAATTISGHVVDLYDDGRIDRTDVSALVSPALRKTLPKIYSAFAEIGTDRLKPVFDKLRGVCSYDDLRLARILFEDKK